MRTSCTCRTACLCGGSSLRHEIRKAAQRIPKWLDEGASMTTLQKTLIGAAMGAAIGTAIYQAHQNSRLHDRVITLTRQQASVAEQIQQLTRERDEAKSRLTWPIA